MDSHTGITSVSGKLEGTAGRLVTRICVHPHPEGKWRYSKQFPLSSKAGCSCQNNGFLHSLIPLALKR